jgi:DNA-binding GntR family transcriptional regulator
MPVLAIKKKFLCTIQQKNGGKAMRRFSPEPSKNIEKRTDRTLSNQVYEALKKDIINCWISPAQMVYAKEIAQKYQVSNVPVREAIKRLMQEGLIQSIPGIGHVVTPITLKDIRDLIEMRCILERASVKRAAEIATIEQLDKIEKLVGEPYPLDTEDSHIRWHKSNVEFHVSIAEASNNERLIRSVRSIMEEMSRLAHMNITMPADSSTMVREHSQILKALRQRDADLAIKLTMLAIDKYVRLVQKSLSVSVFGRK